MRRKRSGDNGGGSLDSLLDTLTNVVGILVIVLVVTQLGVGDAVKRIQNLDVRPMDLTPELQAQTEQEAQELKTLLASLRNDLDELERTTPETEEEISKINADIQQLQEQIQAAKDARIDPAKIREQNAELTQKVKALESGISSTEEELAKLKAMLDTTPAPKPFPAEEIYLPNPRQVPKDVTPVEFLCRHGKIYPLDVVRLRKRAELELTKLLRGDDPSKGLDCQKIIDHFEKEDVGDAFIRLKVVIVSGKPQFVIEPRPEAGDDREKLQDVSSMYRQRLKLIDRTKNYVKFLVWGDSFDVYVEARPIAERRELACGWQPYNPGDQFRDTLDIPWQVTCTGYVPPKPQPPDPNKPPEPARKPLPATQID